MKRDYCTLFDRNYLAKGLSLHASLMRHSSEPFTLHILAMDEVTVSVLNELNLPNIKIIPLAAFEYELKLAGVKATRTHAEYCWTVASCLMKYLMPTLGRGEITYLDSDLFFYRDPKRIFDEIDNRSIGIIPHRFPPHKKYMEGNGIYNVGWVSAKNTDAGKACIFKWAAQCYDWCFNRQEPGKFADQKYLDSWDADFPGEVASIQNVGVGLAPWNIAQYNIDRISNWVCVNHEILVMYHFHEFVDRKHLTNYELRPTDIEYVYQPYLTEWDASNERMAAAMAAIRQRQQELELEGQRA